MPQQVNLCLPLLRKHKSSFGAQTLMQAMAVVLVGGGVLGAGWVWNLNQASASLQQTLAAQARELEAMNAALQSNQAGSGSALAASQQVMAKQRAQLTQRQQALAALQQGHLEPGFGQAARLQLVAQTIAPQAWITQLRADDNQLEVTGYTLEPAVLTAWINRLAQSPLLKGQALSSVLVERVKSDAPLPGGALDRQSVATAGPAGGASSPKPTALPPRWSFTLLSSMAKPAPESVAKP